MELGPILRALFYNRTRFVLIAIEVALTLAIVVNCVNMILEERRVMNQASGLDEENILALTVRPYGDGFSEKEYAESVREEDVRVLQFLPGVRAATQINQLPLSGGGSATSRKPKGSEIDTIIAPYFMLTEQGLDTLGVELVAGRAFNDDDFRREDEQMNVIISQVLAEKLFADGDAVGKQIESGSGAQVDTVIGIVRHMVNSWPTSPFPDSVMLIPRASGRADYYFLMVRAEPGALEDLYGTVEEALLASNSERLIEVRTLGEVRGTNFRGARVVIQLLTGVMVLLVLVTALGIVGLTSFSVTQRQRQIGVRRALGATRAAVLRYFLTENWIITTTGILVGAGLAYLLNYGLMSYASSVKLSWHLVALGALFLWLVGLLAAFTPAWRGTQVAPVVATRSV